MTRTERRRRIWRNDKRKRRAAYRDGDTISPEQYKALHDGQHGRCCYCGVEFDNEHPSTLEHKTPLSRGGAHETANWALACGPCNVKKGRRTVAEYELFMLEEWMAWRKDAGNVLLIVHPKCRCMELVDNDKS
jgi:5-methylcytosine-specific restriction endonuclease McrA